MAWVIQTPVLAQPPAEPVLRLAPPPAELTDPSLPVVGPLALADPKLGETLGTRKLLSAALGDLRKKTGGGPETLRVLRAVVLALGEAGRFQDAAALLLEAGGAEGRTARACLVDAQVRKGRLAEASGVMAQTADLEDPSRADPSWAAIAEAHLDRGEASRAIEILGERHKVSRGGLADADFERVRYRIVEKLASEGRLDQALAVASSMSSALNGGVLRGPAGSPGGAQKLLPHKAMAYGKIVLALNRSGRAREARRLLRRTFPRSDSREAEEVWSETLRLLGAPVP